MRGLQLLVCTSIRAGHDGSPGLTGLRPTFARHTVHCVNCVKVLAICCAIVLTSLVAPAENTTAVSPAEKMYLHGVSAAKSGDELAAQKDFREAWGLDNGNPKYLQSLEESYIYNHQLHDALDLLRVYVKRSGPTQLGWTLQAEVLFQMRQYDLAFRSAESALKLSSNDYRAHEIIALIFTVYERYPAGLKEMEIAAAQGPTSPQIQFYLGRLHASVADFLAARNNFIACLQLNPVYPRALENLGLTHEALGAPAKAMIEYRQALALEEGGKTPRSEYPYLCLGLLLEKQGQTKEALSLVEQGWRRNPNSTWANFERGRLLLDTNQEASAEYFLKRAESLDPTFSRVHFLLARLYRKTSRPAEARSEIVAFTKLNKVVGNREPRETALMTEKVSPELPTEAPGKIQLQGVR